MQKKKWKKITAFVLAAFMAVTLPNVPHNKYELRAENVNLFTDGDLGDDTSDDLWGESPWSLEVKAGTRRTTLITANMPRTERQAAWGFIIPLRVR